MTLKEKLKSLESDLQQALSQSDSVAKLKTEIASLKKLISDQESNENQYAKEYAGFVQDRSKRQALTDAQGKIVQDNTSEDERKRVAAEVGEVDAKIADLTEQLKAAIKKSDETLQALTNKKTATKDALDKLGRLKEPWKGAQKTLKDADTLIALNDQQIQAKNYPVAWFLFKDTQLSIKSANLDDPDTYSKALAQATGAVFDATNDEQAAKEDSDRKAADKTTAQKAADEARTKRQDNIVRRINEGATVPVPPSPAPAARQEEPTTEPASDS